MHLHIHAQYICAPIQYINKSIRYHFFMPSLAVRGKKKTPSLPLQLSASGPDDAHVKEHIQHMSAQH